MTAPKTDIGVPFDQIIGTVDGKPVQISHVWLQHFDLVASAAKKLREAAELMDTLAATPTETQIATAWNELREKLQEIV